MVKSTMTETCSAALRSRRNCSSDGAERRDDGRAFHARAAVTGKARSPSVVRRVDGMTRVDVEALRRRSSVRRGSRILQGRVSNPSERGTSFPPPPIILTHVTGTKQFFGLRRNSWRQAVVRHLELCQIPY